MQLSGGRAYQMEGLASAKAPERECTCHMLSMIGLWHPFMVRTVWNDKIKDKVNFNKSLIFIKKDTILTDWKAASVSLPINKC